MMDSERRGDRRRKLELPVTFCCLSEQGFKQRRHTGQISNVGGGGMCIQVKSTHDRSAGNKLIVLIPLQNTNDPENCVSMVQITAEVVWLDQASFSFGLKYL